MATIKIKRGDTLGKIARALGTTVQALMAANPQLSDPNKISAGASLQIPPDATLGVAPTPRARPGAISGAPLAPPPMPRPRPAAPGMPTLPPPPLPGELAAQGQAFGPSGVSGAASLYSPATLAPIGAVVPPPPVAGGANLIGLPMPGGAAMAGTNGAAGSASLDAPTLEQVLAARFGNSSPSDASIYDAVGMPKPAPDVRALSFSPATAGASSYEGILPEGSSWFGMGDTPGTYSGDKTMVTSQPLPSSATLKPDALVQGAVDAGLVPGWAKGVAWGGMPFVEGMASQIDKGLPPGIGDFDPKTNKLTLTPETVAQFDSALGAMGPFGDWIRGQATSPTGLASQYAALDIPPAETFPLPIPRPATPTATPATPTATGATAASDPFAKFYTGDMAPPTAYNGMLYPTQGLKANKVNTIAIDEATGLPETTQTAAVDPTNQAYWDKFYGGFYPPAAPPTQTAQTPSPTLDFDPSVPTPQPQRSYGLPYSGGGAPLSVYGDQAYVDKTTFVDPLIPSGALPQSQVPTGVTQIADASIIPPTPFPYPIKGLPTPPPLEPASEPVQITIGGMGTQPPAVATELATEPSYPAEPPQKVQPGMMNRAVQAPPSVTLASGKSVPSGTQGSAQGGRYQYQVMPDGSVWNTTLGRQSAPPTNGIPAVPPPSTNPANVVPNLPAAPPVPKGNAFDHIGQLMRGEPVSGGLLSLFNNKPNVPGSAPPQASNTKGGDYWTEYMKQLFG